MLVKITNGKVELRKENGALVRTIVISHAIDADLNKDETLVLVTLDNGKVELRKENGALVRTIVISHAVKARFNNSDIAITLDNGN